MGSNRRDLHIGIDGDSRGLEGAFERSEAKARGLDRELARLERQQAANEKVTTRATAAVDRFGKAQDKAALAAHRLGLEAKRAAEQAEQAEVRAAAAAEAAEKGLLDKTKAARIAARADDAVERAALKAAEAHRAQARAADEAADQERQLARDAELASAASRLGALKAAGAIDTHNAVVRRLTERYGDLSKEAGGAFQEIEKPASGLSKRVQEFGDNLPFVVKLVAGLAAVPFAASAAETAVAGGLGLAVAGVGLAATKSDKQVQAALRGMTSHIKSETARMAAPFKQTWMTIAQVGEETFDELAPHIERDFAKLAPAVSRFAHDAGYSLTLLAPGVDAATDASDKLLASFGSRLPTVARNANSAIEILSKSAGRNADDIANLAANVSGLLPPLAHVIDYATRFGGVVNPVFDLLAHGQATVSGFRGGLETLTGGLIKADHSLQIGGGQFKSFADQAATGGVKLSALDKDMQTLASDTASVTDKANALTDAFNRLLNPAEAVFTDTAKLKEGVGELAKALKKSHGSLTDNTAASRAAKQAFTGVLDSTKSLASDMINSGKSIDQVRASLNPYIHSLYEAAGGNKQAKALVDAFVKSLGLVPPKKSTSLTLDDREFLARLHAAQGLKIDPKTGLLKGDGSGYFNAWLKANHLRLDTKTGRFRGDNADYYNKWLKANGLRIDPKTGVIKGNTAAFWSAVHSIPTVVGSRYIDVTERIKTRVVAGHPEHAAGGPIHRAGGGAVGMAGGGPSGPVVGPGSGTSDDIPVWLSNGEYVIRASQAAKYGPLLDDINQGRNGFAGGGAVGRYATGGTVDDMASLAEILQHWADTKSPTSKKDVDAAVKARKTQINQLKNAEDALYRARHARHRSARDIAAAERRVAAERDDVAAATKKLADVEQRYKYGKLSPANQLGSALTLSIKDTGAFIANLTTLANRGFGVLAQHLLAQGDATAEKTAADAVKMSGSKLAGLNKQVAQADQQATTLATLGSILTIKTAMTGGANTWDQLITATGLAPNDLAAALKLMSADLAKTAAGQALLAMMRAHGFVRGGEITGPAGTDRVPLWGTAGEWVVPKGPAAQHRQLLAALTYGRPLPAGTARGGDGASAGRPIEIHVHARDTASAVATAKAVSHELGWKLKQGGVS